MALLLVLLRLPTVGGDEIQKELATKLVQNFDNLLCKDSDFIACVGLNQKSCEKLIRSIDQTLCNLAPPLRGVLFV